MPIFLFLLPKVVMFNKTVKMAVLLCIYLYIHTLDEAYQLIFTIDKILMLIWTDEVTCVSLRCSRYNKKTFHNSLILCFYRKEAKQGLC